MSVTTTLPGSTDSSKNGASNWPPWRSDSALHADAPQTGAVYSNRLALDCNQRLRRAIGAARGDYPFFFSAPVGLIGPRRGPSIAPAPGAPSLDLSLCIQGAGGLVTAQSQNAL